MTLMQALSAINGAPPAPAGALRVFLGCGFTPLHLQTFLHGHLQQRFSTRRVTLETGLYGDPAGNLERAAAEAFDSAAVVIEWADLDPRLDIRRLGGWAPESLRDMAGCVTASLARIEAALGRLGSRCPVALALPGLPLPPFDLPAGWQAGTLELELEQSLACFAVRAARLPGVRLVSPRRLNFLSPAPQRGDPGTELSNGFPYRLEHAGILAGLLASLLENPPPKKGIITDLDDTCWKGILGEVGVDGICWDLAGHAQLHGLYQQFLNALAGRGVLVAVASKNDPALVEQAFRREHIPLCPASVFPVLANWGPKSQSVARILKAWNIAADAVVFVDDSAMELAEVQSAHPGMECLLFPKQDPAAALALLERLRDLFGKPSVSEEDRIRGASLRGATVLSQALDAAASVESVLQQAEANIAFRLGPGPGSARAFELVNKTNQFNLNGRRCNEAEWQGYFRRENAFLLTVSYRDRFGPLGEIAVIAGRKLPSGELRIETWVMSCRAFSRRIEHQSLRYLFDTFAVDRIVLDWLPTSRNGPVREFLQAFGEPEPEFCLQRESFERACPALYHTVENLV